MARLAQRAAGSLFDPALAIVAEGGLNKLSFRSLAQAAGIGVSSISSLVSSKTQLIEALVDEARRRDRLLCGAVVDLVPQDAALSAGGLAELADLQLENWALNAPLEQIFWSELVQAAATQPDLARIIEPWLAEQRAFWQRLSAATHDDLADLRAQALFGASIDERAHGAALQTSPAYRRLRRMGLIRLCRFDFTGGDDHAATGLFDYLVAQLGMIDDQLQIDKHGAGAAEIKHMGLAVAAARVLAWDGASELTHRAVAARANVPVSTLAYYYRTSEDLLKGAMQAIILGLKNAMFAPDVAPVLGNEGSPGYFIARSTFTLALEASRAPHLVASAADMRRKRGINLVRARNAQLPKARQIDALGAQALAVAATGTMLLGAMHGIEAATAAANALVEQLLTAQGQSSRSPRRAQDG